MKIICNTEGHFKPEDLQVQLRKDGQEISLTTIYRNLSLLVQAGIIRCAQWKGTSGAGAAVYEHIWGRDHHDHLTCSRCGKTADFSYPAIDVLQEAVAREHGFFLESHHLELVGICPDCQNAKSGEKVATGDLQ